MFTGTIKTPGMDSFGLRSFFATCGNCGVSDNCSSMWILGREHCRVFDNPREWLCWSCNLPLLSERDIEILKGLFKLGGYPALQDLFDKINCSVLTKSMLSS